MKRFILNAVFRAGIRDGSLPFGCCHAAENSAETERGDFAEIVVVRQTFDGMQIDAEFSHVPMTCLSDGFRIFVPLPLYHSAHGFVKAGFPLA